MTGNLHRRLGRGTAFTLTIVTLIAACAGPTGPTGTPPVTPGTSPAAAAGSPVPAQTGRAIGASPAPTSAATGTSGGPTLTTTFVRDETKGQEEFGLTKTEIVRRVDATEGPPSVRIDFSRSTGPNTG